MADDLRSVRDDLEADMAAHQRRFAGEVTASSNQTLAAEAMQRLENEQRQATAVAASPQFAAPVPERTVRDGQHGQYVVDTVAHDDTKIRKATEAELWFMRHAMPRIELLMSKMDSGPLGSPSWRDRVLAVMQLRQQSIGLRVAGLVDVAADYERRYTFELMELLEASNTPFGDWKADAPQSVRVGWTPAQG